MAEVEPAVPILAAFEWPENGHLIAACARLGYLRKEWRTLDPTYGRGTWWKFWRPDDLVTFNRGEDGSDFRNLPLSSGNFEAIAFDPPYVSKGGRSTSGIKEMDERYGQDDAPPTPALLQDLINLGLYEMNRLLAHRGVLLVKCQNYVSSGKLWMGVHRTTQAGLDLGLEVVDFLQHVGRVRPQPKRTRADGQPVRQQHARQNYSTLIVFRKP